MTLYRTESYMSTVEYWKTVSRTIKFGIELMEQSHYDMQS